MAKNSKKIRIFSALEVANLCGVVNQTAINWIRNGYLKAFTTPGGQYRVYAEDLIVFLEGRGMRVPSELGEYIQDDVDWHTVLVIDDDNDVNELIKRFLTKRNEKFTVFQAYDGFEAGRLLSEKHPGVVFLDINLPNIDGRSLCRKIKDDPGFGKPFVLAITGLDRPEEREIMLQNGADAFFGKPLDFEAIGNTLNELMGRVEA